jgi:hypothetical protein
VHKSAMFLFWDGCIFRLRQIHAQSLTFFNQATGSLFLANEIGKLE